MKNTFARMKARWGVGPIGVLAILLIFALTGSSVLYLGRPVMDYLLPENAVRWQRVVVYIIVIFPLYHVLLLVYAALLGKFRFFWDRERAILQRMRRWVRPPAQ